MFEVISNPFEEMTQGVVSNGHGYSTEKRSRSYAWIWWLLLPILVMGGGIIYVNYQDKKLEEAKKLAEAKLRRLEEEKTKQNLAKV